MLDVLSGLGLPELVLVFGLSAGAVGGAGIVLARSGDAIAERTGLGGLVVGMFLLAGATSLPEIATDMSAALAGAPDLAVGDLFGSSMANMAILALVDLVYRGLAAVIHGTQTRIRRLEPDAVGVLLVHVLLPGAVWVSTS